MTGPTLSRQANLDWRAVGNFLGGGTGGGLAVTAAALQLATGHAQWLADLLAILLIVAGLATIRQEIGGPERMRNLLKQSKISWATREALLGVALLVAVLAAIVFGGNLTAWFVMVLGGAFLYAQARILQGTEAVPAWRDPRIVALTITTGLAEGAGLLAVLTALTFSVDMLAAARFAFVLVVLRWPVWTVYRDRLSAQLLPPGMLKALKDIDQPFGLGASAAPALLLVIGFVATWFAIPLLAAGGLLAFAGGWALKVTLLTRAPFNQGVTPPGQPARGAVPEPTNAQPA
jgi:phenylacetyl-CoA:acceptor oxidoreductase subunit 2